MMWPHDLPPLSAGDIWWAVWRATLACASFTALVYIVVGGAAWLTR